MFKMLLAYIMKFKNTTPATSTIFILIHILFVQFQSISAISDEIPKDFFKGITLSKPAPTVLISGETYVFQGKIINFPNDKEVIIQISPPETDFIEFRDRSENGTFSIPVTFTHEGVTGLMIHPLYKPGNSVFITVVKKIDFSMTLPFPIASFEIISKNNKTILFWESQNKLFKLIFNQGNKKRQFKLSGNPTSLALNPVDFKDFEPGEITVSIHGARSLDGSLFRKTSNWSNPVSMNFKAVTHEFNYINFYKLRNIEGVTSHLKIGDELVFRAKSLEMYYSNAYVITPELSVKLIPIQSSGIRTNYCVGGLFPKNSSFKFRFESENEGTYILEINSQDGNALLNFPIYVGGIHPVIPGFMDLDNEYQDKFDQDNISEIRKSLLKVVNDRRTQLELNPLSLTEDLNLFSQNYAEALGRAGKIGHKTTSEGSLKRRKRKSKIRFDVSENLALARTPLLALEYLFHSPAHYFMLIKPEARVMGIGISEMAKNEIVIVQHIAPLLIAKPDKEKFINLIINRLNENRKIKLKRVSNLPEEKNIKQSFGPIRATSLEMITRLVLQEKYIKIINQGKNANTIFITRFEQEADGFYFGFVIGQDEKKQ
jgi:uncharacterized protein YkwD